MDNSGRSVPSDLLPHSPPYRKWNVISCAKAKPLQLRATVKVPARVAAVGSRGPAHHPSVGLRFKNYTGQSKVKRSKGRSRIHSTQTSRPDKQQQKLRRATRLTAGRWQACPFACARSAAWAHAHCISAPSHTRARCTKQLPADSGSGIAAQAT